MSIHHVKKPFPLRFHHKAVDLGLPEHWHQTLGDVLPVGTGERRAGRRLLTVSTAVSGNDER